MLVHVCVSLNIHVCLGMFTMLALHMYCVTHAREYKPLYFVCLLFVCSVFVCIACVVFPCWTVSEHRVLSMVTGTHSRTRRTCSWWWTSCWGEICATTCSRVSSSARTPSNSTSVRWPWHLTTCGASTSSIGTHGSLFLHFKGSDSFYRLSCWHQKKPWENVFLKLEQTCEQIYLF